MRRFLLLVFLSCAAASAVFALMPSQLAGSWPCSSGTRWSTAASP